MTPCQRPRSPASTGPSLTPSAPTVERYAAFTVAGRGGNPAGVVLDAAAFSDADMQRIAAEVNYSETAFLTVSEFGADGRRHHRIRYFSPQAEVAFCGHATIAA